MVSGDADGDGRDDLLVGGVSTVYLFRGPLTADTNVSNRVDFSLTLVDAHDDWARSLAISPDRDGDGVPELVVATTGPDAASPDAAILLVPGGASGTLSQADALQLAPGEFEVAAADFDGDGVGDLVVGDPAASFGALYEPGVATVLWGAD